MKWIKIPQLIGFILTDESNEYFIQIIPQELGFDLEYKGKQIGMFKTLKEAKQAAQDHQNKIDQEVYDHYTRVKISNTYFKHAANSAYQMSGMPLPNYENGTVTNVDFVDCSFHPDCRNIKFINCTFEGEKP